MSNAALWHYLIWFIVIHVWSLHHPACQRRNLSASDVSKERRDIKHNYNGFLTPEVDSEPQSWVDLCISHTITRIFHLWGVMHQKSIQETSSTCLSLVQRGSYSEEHKESKETDSPLQTTMTASLSSRRGTKSQWDAAVCRCVAAAHPSQTDRRRDRPALHSWAEFNCGLWFDWNSLLKLPPLHSSLCLRAWQPKNAALRRGSHLPSMGRHIFQLCTRGKGIRGLIPA